MLERAKETTRFGKYTYIEYALPAGVATTGRERQQWSCAVLRLGLPVLRNAVHSYAPTLEPSTRRRLRA
jgi:hypothetical protein